MAKKRIKIACRKEDWRGQCCCTCRYRLDDRSHPHQTKEARMDDRTDRELLELAAMAAGYTWRKDIAEYRSERGLLGLWLINKDGTPLRTAWNPLEDDRDRLRLCRALGISIDFSDCCAWKRLPDGSLIQEFWGGDYGDEAHAVLRAAVSIGREGE